MADSAAVFFPDARSSQMKQFVRDEAGFRELCQAMDKQGLRCVGFWSGQEEIDAVHHYAQLFAKDAVKECEIWMPYWYRDARLIGLHRLAYLIKGTETYLGAMVMDLLGYDTLTWVWLTPTQRRRGVFAGIWKQLEHCHPGFKVQAPLSSEMQSFLRRNDPDGTHEVVIETGVPRQ